MMKIESYKIEDNNIIFKTEEDGPSYKWTGKKWHDLKEKYLKIFATNNDTNEETTFRIEYNEIENNQLNDMLFQMEKLNEKSIKQMFYDDCWYYKKAYEIDERVIDNSYRYLWDIRKPERYQLYAPECCECINCPHEKECEKFDDELFYKQKDIESKIKGEIKKIFNKCKTHDTFIENVAKILDKYFTYGFDMESVRITNCTFHDHLYNFSDTNHIDLSFSNFKDNPCGTINIHEYLDIKTENSTIENGASFDDLNIKYYTNNDIRKFHV